MRGFALAPFFLFLFSCFPAAAEAATLRGTVRDADGRPVPGARVVVTGATPGVSQAVTDSEGRFTFDALPAGQHHVHVAVDGFTADAHSLDATADSTHTLTITLRVSALSESLVVSAAHVDLPLSAAASSVSVVRGADIEARQVRTIGDALRTVPGLEVAQNSMLGSLTSLFTRGGDSDFTLVLVDGMRVNSFGGGLDLSQVPLVSVERVEIVRGPQSAVFGSDAIGGVVQIVTRRCGRSPCDRVDGSLEGGSLGSIRGRAAAAGARGAFSWDAHAEHAQTDGYRGIAPATGEAVGNDDGRVQHAGGAIGWTHEAGADVRGQAQFSFTDRGFAGAYGSNPIGAYTSVDRISRGETNRRQFGARWTQPWGGAASRVRQHTEGGLTDLDANFLSPFGASESDTRRMAFRTQTDASLTSALGVSVGLELLREQGGSTFITGETFEPIPVKRLVSGYFGELRFAPHARLSIAAGVRLERIGRDALEGDPNAFSPRPAFGPESIVSANPRLAVAYLLRGGDGAPSTRLRASAGTGIRPPDAFDIAFTDNPALKPERSRSIDGGVQQTFADGSAVIDITAFFNEYDDLIVTVGRSFRDASRYRTDNISNARSRGLELAGGFRPVAHIDVRASYTWLDTGILAVDNSTEAPAPYRVGERLIRRPRHRGSLAAVLTGSRATAFADLEVRGPVRDVEPTFGAAGGVFDADGYAVLDLGGALRASRLLEIFARVENVSGRAYEQAFGFPAPGRVAIAGVRIAAPR